MFKKQGDFEDFKIVKKSLLVKYMFILLFINLLHIIAFSMYQ